MAMEVEKLVDLMTGTDRQTTRFNTPDCHSDAAQPLFLQLNYLGHNNSSIIAILDHRFFIPRAPKTKVWGVCGVSLGRGPCLDHATKRRISLLKAQA